MTRKSTIITLCILGAIGSLGACCCASGFFEEDNPDPNANPDNPGNQGGQHHHTHRRVWFPYWGGWSHTGGVGTSHPTGTGTGVSSPRGGFGSTGHPSGSGSSSGHGGTGGSSSGG